MSKQVSSCLIMSHHHVQAYIIMSYHVWSCLNMSCHVWSCLTLPWDQCKSKHEKPKKKHQSSIENWCFFEIWPLAKRSWSCPSKYHHVLSCLIIMSNHVSSCLVMSDHVLTCLIMSDHVLPCLQINASQSINNQKNSRALLKIGVFEMWPLPKRSWSCPSKYHHVLSSCPSMYHHVLSCLTMS